MNRRHILSGLATLPLIASVPSAFAESFDPAPSVHSLAAAVRELYHDATIAGRIADRLLASLAAGSFASGQTPQALADLLNREIRTASNDLHFVVMSGTMHHSTVPPTPPHSQTAPFTPTELEALRRTNFGIAAVAILPGNVGRLDLRQFYRPAAEVRGRLGAAMAALADSWAMVVDLTRNVGGDPNTVALLLSYFFDRPSFVVNRFRWRSGSVEEFRTTAEPGGPRFGETKPLVVLVSGSTYSAAEEFAYDVQALRRGTIVGEVSGGGANHALPVTIVGGLTAFIPQARAENPVTGTNWERAGVQPDVRAAGGAIARVGHRLALDRILAGGDPIKAGVVRQLQAVS